MLDLSANRDPAVAARRLRALKAEHAYWMQGASCIDATQAFRRVVRMPDGLLNRYYDEFTPRTTAENDVARAIRSDGRVTYEQMLMALTRNGFLLRPVTSLQMDRVMLATILGWYCNLLALSVAVWNGIYLCGGALDEIDLPDPCEAFCDGFPSQGGLRGRLSKIPMMAVDQRGAIIRGVAEFSAR